MERVRDGDREAFAELYRREAPRVFAVLVHLCGARERAEDVLQEVFLKAWRAAPRWRAEAPVGAWLLAIARRAGWNASAFRRRRRALRRTGAAADIEAVDAAIKPERGFMLRYTRERDLALFINASHQPRPNNVDEVPMRALIPAFMISELKTAFQIGFLIYLPFLIIDIVVASILLAMGMMVLPPIMISLPFKLMLFVLVDGWNLLTQSLLGTFQ